MAKTKNKATKAERLLNRKRKLTGEEKEEIEQMFHRVRDQTLRQWYEEAHDGDAEIKASAQARLQLQLWLRDSRREVATFKNERDEFKAEGKADDMDDARKKMKRAQCAMSSLMKMVQGGIPATTAKKACRQWARLDLPLEFVLADLALDKRSDFGVNRDSILNSLKDYEKNDEASLRTSLDTMTIEDRNDTIEPENEEQPSNLVEPVEPVLDPTSIWAQHTLHIQRRYRFSELPTSAVETKLAFQKKMFEDHVNREEQLRTAVEITMRSTKNFHGPLSERLRKGVEISCDSALSTSSPSEHSIWELTSPMLWHHFEDGLSWDLPQWAPKGLMRIQTNLNQSSIYFEFGTHSFSVEQVHTPAVVSTTTFHYQAKCHQTKRTIDVSITFLVQGIVKVKFPVLDIIASDLGCMHLPLTAVELTGTWMGSCRMVKAMEYCMW